MLHEQGPDFFSFVCVKALQTPRNSLTFRCLHFENSAHFRLHVKPDLCLFNFCKLKYSEKKAASVRHSLLTILSSPKWGRNSKTMNIFINIPTLASQRLHKKLAQKVPSHRCIHIENESLSLSVVCIFYVNVSCIYFYTIF